MDNDEISNTLSAVIINNNEIEKTNQEIINELIFVGNEIHKIKNSIKKLNMNFLENKFFIKKNNILMFYINLLILINVMLCSYVLYLKI